MITKSISQMDVLCLMALDFARSIPKAVYAAFVVMVLVLMGQPVQAAPKVLPAATDPGAFIGCPSLEWAAPLTGTSQNITGMITGFAIIAILLIMFANGMRLVFANNRADKAAGAIEGVKHAGIGAIMLFVGVPVAALIIWGLAIAFNPACRP